MLTKLTDQDGKTRAGLPTETQWGENITHKATGDPIILCTNRAIHWYADETLAVLFNPIHARIPHPIGWEVVVQGETVQGTTKCGSRQVTTIRRIRLPKFTTTQRIAFGIIAVMELTDQPREFIVWADKWLSAEDRSPKAAAMATDAGYWAAGATNATVAGYWAAKAAYAADAAAKAAYAAACAAGWAVYAADLDDIIQTLILCALAAKEIR